MSASKAEAAGHADPRTACFYARRALELAVSWAYKHDAALRMPYQDNLSALIHEPSFKQAAGRRCSARRGTLSANQFEFGNLIVDHRTAHGIVEPARLFEPPFTALSVPYQRMVHRREPLMAAPIKSAKTTAYPSRPPPQKTATFREKEEDQR